MRPHSRQATWLAWLAGPNNVGQVLSPCLTRDGWSMACPFPTLVLSKVQLWQRTLLSCPLRVLLWTAQPAQASCGHISYCCAFYDLH